MSVLTTRTPLALRNQACSHSQPSALVLSTVESAFDQRRERDRVVVVSDHRIADGERPDGPLSGMLYDASQQCRAAGRHCAAEGHPADIRTVIESYDRALHPWLHGRRFHDIKERVVGWFR